MPDTAARLQQVERVVANTDQFKRRLGIGEDAYTTRRAWRSLSQAWGTVSAASMGAGAAQSALVASTFFAPAASANPLVWIGIMAPAAAVTPVGWVVAAALAAGGAWYGVSRWMAAAPDPFVDVIPRFLNSPVDLLGMRLLDLNAALAFGVAAADGVVAPSERAAIRDHFEHEWGYAPAYLDVALPLIEGDATGTDIDRLVAAIVEFHARSRDCAPDAMQREMVAFLAEVAEADGVDATEERELLATVARTLAGARSLSLKQAAQDLADWGSTLRDAAQGTASAAQDRGHAVVRTARSGVAQSVDLLASKGGALRAGSADAAEFLRGKARTAFATAREQVEEVGDRLAPAAERYGKALTRWFDRQRR